MIRVELHGGDAEDLRATSLTFEDGQVVVWHEAVVVVVGGGGEVLGSLAERFVTAVSQVRRLVHATGVCTARSGTSHQPSTRPPTRALCKAVMTSRACAN